MTDLRKLMTRLTCGAYHTVRLASLVPYLVMEYHTSSMEETQCYSVMQSCQAMRFTDTIVDE